MLSEVVTQALPINQSSLSLEIWSAPPPPPPPPPPGGAPSIPPYLTAPSPTSQPMIESGSLNSGD